MDRSALAVSLGGAQRWERILLAGPPPPQQPGLGQRAGSCSGLSSTWSAWE